ncbi:WYL domain-containing protein [Clostridium sp. ZBS15]|uniref:helix-turn-helix transcriptional regulator n=1 Tax=Clostridium sp. ZBS15 TaxID=2949969 RepID=UPI00207A5CD7|nr:WYL domain-containing protein [Clostridium sp. ZBS15]
MKNKSIENNNPLETHRFNIYLILDILKKYSSVDEPISSSDIFKKLCNNYYIKIDKSTIGRFLAKIIEIQKSYCSCKRTNTENIIASCNCYTGFDFKVRQCYKKNNTYIYNALIDPNASTNTTLKYESDNYSNKSVQYYYIEPDLSENEINLLSDAIEVYSYISFDDTKKLIDKLNKLLPKSKQKFFNNGLKNWIASQKLDNLKNVNIDILKNIGILRNIINKKIKAEIIYGEYTNHQLVAKKGYPKKITPYLLMWSNGYYYLIAKNPSYINLVNFRVDRILKVTPISDDLVNFKADPIYDPDNLFTNNTKSSIIPGKYRATHVIMYSGDIKTIEIMCRNTNWMINTLYDCFGFEIKILPIDENWIKVTIKSSVQGVILWATQYCRDCKVIHPPEVVNGVKEQLYAGLKNYE